MSKKYRELVAIQVSFSKVTAKYNLSHYYRLVTPEEKGGPMQLRGYDMERHESIKEITDALRDAYAPAILSVWQQDEIASVSEVLQFQVGARPEELQLDGDWTLWAEL